MTKLNWSKAKNIGSTEPARPGRKPRRKILKADNWDDLERIALGPQKPPKPAKPNTAVPKESQPASLEAKLLHETVMMLTNAGLAHLLADVPDVLAYYGGSLPTVADVLCARPNLELITGGITLDDKVWSFSCARTVRA